MIHTTPYDDDDANTEKSLHVQIAGHLGFDFWGFASYTGGDASYIT